MATFDKDTTENTAKPRGSGGGLQSKALPNTANSKGAGGVLESKSISDADAGAADAQQQPEDKHEPETSDQTTTDS